MAEAHAAAGTEYDESEWRRLSPWSMLHFAARAIAQSIRALFVAAPATYGAAQSPFAAYAWTIPATVVIGVLVSSALSYLYFRFRVRADAVEVHSGVLFKKRLHLAFARIQNINLEDPFYFRPLGLVTLKLDSAGATGDEVHLAALQSERANSLRAFILRRKSQLGGDDRVLQTEMDGPPQASEVCFTRSIEDLIVHGLTNNRAYLAIAAIVGLVWQADIPVTELAVWIGIDLDLLLASPVGWLVVLFAIAFIGTGVAIAALSVVVAIVFYYGFTISRTRDGLRIARGLLTRHDIHVQTSRLQAVVIRQDWLELLIGRSNVVLEQISHGRPPGSESQSVRQKILVPSVRAEEIALLTREVFGWARLAELSFMPISRRYFWKYAALVSLMYALALALPVVTPVPFVVFLPLWLAICAAHLWAVHMTWRRAGLAIDADIVVARYGTIGVNYHVFPAFKIQNASHVQSVLMRRKGVSNVVFRTAASQIGVPYLPTEHAKAAVDYCVFAAESGDRSWM